MLEGRATFRVAAFLVWSGLLIPPFAAAQLSVEKVTDLSRTEVRYPTPLSQLYRAGISPAGAGELVSENMTIPSGGSILTGQANTYITAPELLSLGVLETYLFDNTFVTFDSLNRWAIDRGAMYIVNQRGRLEILKIGLARILADSELLINVTPSYVDVYVVSGQVTVESLATGGVVVLTATMAARATSAGAQTLSLTATQQSVFQQQIQTAQQVMNPGGIGVEVALAAAAAGGALAAVAVLDEPEADMTVAVTGFPVLAELSAPITYALEVGNRGPQAANEVRMVDNLPPGTTLLGVEGAACTGGASLTCELGTLANGARIPIVIRVRATTVGLIENVVSVTAKEKDPDSGNNTARASTNVSVVEDACADFGGVYRCSTFDFLGGPGGIPNRLQPGLTLTCDGPTNSPLRPVLSLTNFWTCRGDSSSFITVTGPLENSRYIGRGFGSYAGLEGASFKTQGEMITRFDRETCTLRDGEYRVGSDGSLPGGVPLSWRFECRKQ